MKSLQQQTPSLFPDRHLAEGWKHLSQTFCWARVLAPDLDQLVTEVTTRFFRYTDNHLPVQNGIAFTGPSRHFYKKVN